MPSKIWLFFIKCALIRVPVPPLPGPTTSPLWPSVSRAYRSGAIPPPWLTGNRLEDALRRGETADSLQRLTRHRQAEPLLPLPARQQLGISGSFHLPLGLVKATLAGHGGRFRSCAGVRGPGASPPLSGLGFLTDAQCGARARRMLGHADLNRIREVQGAWTGLPHCRGGGVSASPKGASLYKIRVINPETPNQERPL